MAEGAEAPQNEMANEAPDAVKAEDTPETPEEADVLEEDDDFEEFEDDGMCLQCSHTTCVATSFRDLQIS